MSKLFSPKLLFAILIALFFFVSLYLRVSLPYDRVFSGSWIKYTSSDAYYYMRLVDNLVHNFPHVTLFDPYFIYPGGEQVTVRFFGWFLAGITWLIGLGSPTQHTVDLVGVYFPAILGALTVIPAYFIGKELFGRWAGVLSAGLLAILPGEFLGRSILGFTDHHIAEALFTLVAMLFLILAIKDARQKQLTFGHFKRRNWAAIKKPVIYSVLAGLFLGLYFLTWMGALLFVFIISVFIVVQFIIEHVRGRSGDYLGVVSVILFSVTLILFIPFWSKIVYTTSLIIALVIPLALSGISWVMRSKKIRVAYYPLALAGLGLAGIGLLYLINPSLLGVMLGQFAIFFPKGTQLTTIEMQPLISSIYGNPFTIAWGNFTTGFFLSFIALGILIYLVIKGESTEKTLLLVWSLIILVATLGQRRFGYYLAVNVALLTGYMSWKILELAGFREFTEKILKKRDKPGNLLEAPRKLNHYEILGVSRNATNKEIKKAFQKLALQYHPDRSQSHDANEKMKEINKAYEVLSNRRRRADYDRSESILPQRKGSRARPVASKSSLIINRAVMSLAVLVVFFVVFFWNIEPATSTASQARFAPSDSWISSLSWLKENTPEPFGDSDSYYQLHELPPPGESYQYPESAYGVLAWWDYGYWITRIAHRIPNANPSQDPLAVVSVASFFTSQDEKTASEITQELGSAYIIIDYETAYVDPTTAGGKFWAVATWAGREPTEYFDFYFLQQESQLQGEILLTRVTLFYPEYYRSLAVRLYNFDSEAVVPESTTVISYEEAKDQSGNLLKIITSAENFDTYEEAEAYRSSQESANYRIVSMNPMLSPVPLEALEHYQPIHSSNITITLPDARVVPQVKIFEYVD